MDENWRPEPDFRCPECGAAVEVGDWGDDELENGGACIGSKRRCTACDWSESY